MTTPELVRHRPHPSLAGLVAGIVGLSESAVEAVERRQPAGSLLPVVVSFGDPLEVVTLSDGEGAGQHSSFIAGFMPGARNHTIHGDPALRAGVPDTARRVPPARPPRP